MQTHVAQPRTTSCASPEVSSEPLQHHNLLLENIGPLADEQVLLLGCGPLGLIDLLRSGAVQGVHLRSCERLEPSSASLIIIQDVSSPASLGELLPAVHRALLPTGRLVICPGRNSVMVPPAIRRLLKREGYARVRVIGDGEFVVLKAERPTFGLRLAA